MRFFFFFFLFHFKHKNILFILFYILTLNIFSNFLMCFIYQFFFFQICKIYIFDVFLHSLFFKAIYFFNLNFATNYGIHYYECCCTRISRLNVLSSDDGLMTWRGKNIVKSDQGKLAKDLPIVKSIFSLEHKDGESVNNKTYLDLMGSDPFYREFLVGLLVRIHCHHKRCV